MMLQGPSLPRVSGALFGSWAGLSQLLSSGPSTPIYPADFGLLPIPSLSIQAAANWLMSLQAFSSGDFCTLTQASHLSSSEPWALPPSYF